MRELRLDIWVVCFSLKVTILVNRRIQTSKYKQLIWIGETVDVTYFTKNHSTIDIFDSRNGHEYRIIELNDFCHLSFNLI